MTVAIKIAIYAISTENYISPSVLGDLILEACRSRTATTKDRLHLITTAMPNLDINVPKHLEPNPSEIYTGSKKYVKSPIVFARILESLFLLGFENTCFRLYNSLETFGFERGALMYVTIIKCMLRQQNVNMKNVHYTFSEMKKAGFEPGFGLFVRLVQADYTSGNINACRETIKMLALTHSPQATLYALAVLTECEIYGVSDPQDLLNHMIKHGIKPNIVFFQNWMKRDIVKDQPESLDHILNLAKLHLPEYHTLYTTIIEAHLNSTNIHRAESVASEMLEQGYQMDRNLMTILMKSYIKICCFEKALIIYGQMIGFSFQFNNWIPVKHNQRPDVSAILVIIDPLLECKSYKLLEYIYRKTIEAGHHVPLFKAVVIIKELVSLGYFWPLHLTLKFRNEADRHYCISKANEHLNELHFKVDNDLIMEMEKDLNGLASNARLEEFLRLIVRIVMTPSRQNKKSRIDFAKFMLVHCISVSTKSQIINYHHYMDPIFKKLNLDFKDYNLNNNSIDILGNQTLGLKSTFQIPKMSSFRECLQDYEKQLSNLNHSLKARKRNVNEDKGTLGNELELNPI